MHCKCKTPDPWCDIYLVCNCHVSNIGTPPHIEKEINDTLNRIQDGTYEYVGEVRLKVKPRYAEVHDAR